MISSANQRLGIEKHSNGNYTAVFQPAGASASLSVLAAAPIHGDIVELALTLTAAGVIQLTQSINGAAATSSAASSAVVIDQTWGDATFRFVGSDTALLNAVIERGVRTLGYVRQKAGVT
jgi:hypothetical protein